MKEARSFFLIRKIIFIKMSWVYLFEEHLVELYRTLERE